MTPHSATSRLNGQFLLSIIVPALVAVTAGVGNTTGALDHEVSERLGLAAMGMTMMVAGNFLPKVARRFGPLAAGAPGGERIAGWVFVLAGLVYLGVCLAAPEDHYHAWASFVGLAACSFALANWIRDIFTSGPGPRPGKPEADITETTTRLSVHVGILILLTTLAGIFGLTFVDQTWNLSWAMVSGGLVAIAAFCVIGSVTSALALFIVFKAVR